MATRGDVEAQPLVPGRAAAREAAASTGSRILLATAHSSHKSMFKLTGRMASRQVQTGAKVHLRSTPPGTATAVQVGARGTVTQLIETADRGTLAMVFFEGSGAELVPVSSVGVITSAPALGQVQDDSHGAAGPALAEPSEWLPYEYKPGDEPILRSVALVLLGELYQRQGPHGLYEYKRAYTWLNLLMIFVPLSFIANYADLSSAVTFIFSFLAIVPLAGMLGHFTEDLAGHVGSALGALLNASFGNATEIIISIFAVKESLFSVIKNSMLGSVMGNMLLVLGCAFISRSVPNGTEERKREMERSALWTFNAESANVFASLLLLAAFALAVPTAYAQLHIKKDDAGAGDPPTPTEIYDMSRATAIVMVIGYIVFLVFQVKHNEVFNAADRAKDDDGADEMGDPGTSAAQKSEPEEDEEAPKMSKWFDIGGLLFITVLIGFVSEFLVSSLEDATDSMGLSEAWVAVILLPIIGNAAEHATAIVSSYKGDMEIAVGVAIGSSIQIAGFAVPVLVIVSWIVNGQNPSPLTNDDGTVKLCGAHPCPGALDLNFHPFSMTCMVLSVIVVNTIVTDGKGNWLEGITLLITYVVVAVAFWYVPEHSDA
eukprot:TRINITY_DN43564_c0_g1_i1.p1 TRINITY_DN43564_c0_g1~~TRINITY_DN43564_c0_g1_i1.p1  ORF type:complete len:620 (+),score=197.70 TRINITY_DN43564_c0_g1_i1:57-1862(+)